MALKENIRREISSIEPSLLQRVAQNTRLRFEQVFNSTENIWMTYSLKNKIRIFIVSFNALNKTLCQLLRSLFKFENINLPPDTLITYCSIK